MYRRHRPGDLALPRAHLRAPLAAADGRTDPRSPLRISIPRYKAVEPKARGRGGRGEVEAPLPNSLPLRGARGSDPLPLAGEVRERGTAKARSLRRRRDGRRGP